MLVLTAHRVTANHQLGHWRVHVTAIENLYDAIPFYRPRIATSLLKSIQNQLFNLTLLEPCTIRHDDTHAK